jgi:C-terminal processing protease CtpA/Prc
MSGLDRRPVFYPVTSISQLRRIPLKPGKTLSPSSCALAVIATICAMAFIPLKPATAQSLSSVDRDRARAMLKTIKEDIKKHYYDPNFHAMDVDARFLAAEEKIKSATTNGQLFGIIAHAMADLNDSHTRFIPPPRASSTEYGWQMQIIGDKCFVVAIKPGSDAEAKGLKEGDEVLSVNGYAPTRQNLWKLRYLYYTLSPQGGLLVVAQSPNAEPRQLEIAAKVKQGKKLIDLTDYDEIINMVRESQTESRLNAHRYFDDLGDVFVWKMPQFDLPENKVDELMSKASKRKALILDLRGNGGGDEVTLLRLIGHFFDKDIAIGEIKRRKETKPLVAKSQGDKAYKGQVVVLIDSESGSAAEVFARVIQLEKRGTIIGDQTAGAVMRGKYHSHKLGLDVVIFYGAIITDADLLMTDGKSLEGVGVIPDELRLPTAKDMAGKRDPVLAHAASLVGLKLEPEKAGTLFPVQWSK